jgi:NitT/TauT family transport system substrate-binding protein
MLDPAEVLQARAAGADIQVVYEVMQTGADGIAISAESAFTDVGELEGETVGLVSDRDLVTLKIALDARGLTEDDVTSVVVGEAGPTLAAAFRDQTVAAIAGSGPDWLAIQANGIPIKLITPEEVSNKPGNTFVISGEADEAKRGGHRRLSPRMVESDVCRGSRSRSGREIARRSRAGRMGRPGIRPAVSR